MLHTTQEQNMNDTEAGSILSVESNQNVESKRKKCEVQNSIFTSRNQLFLAFWSVDSQENH